jgi:IclR family acetate operon transcriptional repressor
LESASRLEPFTDRTTTDPRALAKELERVRASGVAEAIGEREPDLGALAAPVLGRGAELLAILGLQGPVGRLPPVKRRRLREPLRHAAESLSRSLGGPGLPAA